MMSTTAAMLGVAAAFMSALALAIGRACHFHADLVPAATVARLGARGGARVTLLVWLALATPVVLAVGAAVSLGQAIDVGAGARRSF